MWVVDSLRRRVGRASLVITGVCAILTGCTHSRPRTLAEPADPPNILLIIWDDFDYEKFGFFGDPVAVTPNMDRLLESAAVFQYAHVTAPTCRPSLAALLSGRYPYETGILNGRAPRALSPENALASLLRDKRGYATFLGGKFWEKTADVYDPSPYGFSLWSDPSPGSNFVRDGQEELLQFLSSTEQPAFVFYSPRLPHVPHNAPQRFLDRVDPQRIRVPAWIASQDREEFVQMEHAFYASAAWLDDEIGAVLDVLGASEKLKNTLIVTMIDNGLSYGHFSKMTPYEKGLRTHVSFTWPGRIQPSRIDDLVSIVDIPATLLDFAKIPVPASYSGTSLLPRLTGQSNQPARDILFGATYSRFRYDDEPPGDEPTLIAIYARTKRWKYLRFMNDVNAELQPKLNWRHAFLPPPDKRSGSEELYDLTADPYERSNLANLKAHRYTLDSLRSKTLVWWHNAQKR